MRRASFTPSETTGTSTGKIDSHTVQIEPNEVYFCLTNTSLDENEKTIIISNIGAYPVYFQTRSTLVKFLRPEPRRGYLGACQKVPMKIQFRSQVISDNIDKEIVDKFLMRKDHITLECVRLPLHSTESGDQENLAFLQQTVRIKRLYLSCDVFYRKDNFDITIEDTEKIRKAFLGTPATVWLSSDSTNHELSAQLPLTNKSANKVIWRTTDLDKIPLSAAIPENGILTANQTVNVILKAKTFSREMLEAQNTIAIEWSAVAKSTVEFTQKQFDATPKTFKVRIKVTSNEVSDDLPKLLFEKKSTLKEKIQKAKGVSKQSSISDNYQTVNYGN